jgi:ABC-type Fe3+/spermidine/putrescine transport system ATPase subunit
VYEHPANRFISTFVGKANLLEGQVVGAAGDRADIAVGGMMLSLESTDTGLRGGGRVVLGLRPEKIRCTARAAAAAMAKWCAASSSAANGCMKWRHRWACSRSCRPTMAPKRWSRGCRRPGLERLQPAPGFHRPQR